MDSGRLKVNKFILHHAVTPHYKNYSDAQIREIFSNFGKAIYAANGITPTGHINPSTGKITYTQAHWALHEYTKDGNKYGYRIVELIKDWEKKLLWHAANWPVNQSSVGMETCMDARNEKLPEKALMLVADKLRPLDKKLGGKLQLFGHSQVSQQGTQCPAKLLGQVPTIIDMINNPDKWNKKLWPAKPATPKPAAVTTKSSSYKKKMVIIADTQLVNIPAGTAVSPAVKLKKNTQMDIADKVTASNGKVFYRTKSSVDGKRMTGIASSVIKDYVAPAPAPKPTPTPAPAPKPVEPAKPELKITRLAVPKDYQLIRNANLWGLDFTKYANARGTQFAENTVVPIVAMADHPLGSRYAMREEDIAARRGFNTADLSLHHVAETPLTPRPDVTESQPAPEQPTGLTLDKRVGALEAAVGGIIALLGSIGSAILNGIKNIKR